MQITDFLIIGQGIAGSVLSFTLKQKGFKVKVVDKIHPSSASRVAAGIWHPMVFKRLSQTWLAHKFIPAAEQCYSRMEIELESSFFHQSNYNRVLSDAEEWNDWDTKSSNQYLSDWMKEAESFPYSHLHTHYGIGGVKRAGYLDTTAFLKTTRHWLKEDLLNLEFVDADLKIDEGGVLYSPDNIEPIRAQRIIFANGLNARNSTWFNWIPFAPAKGEVFTIFSPQLKLKEIISKGVFICPIGNHRYNVGATYHWDRIDEVPTQQGKDQLLSKLDAIINVPFEIVEHRAGVRPAVKGRRPLLGSHPEKKEIMIFNGMGSKAVLMVPFLADMLIDHITIGKSLLEDVDLKRFNSYYNSKNEKN